MFPSLLDYVKIKAESFLKINGLENSFQSIENNAQKDSYNGLNPMEYINSLLNGTVDAVAQNRNEDWNKIREEFNIHYLSKS